MFAIYFNVYKLIELMDNKKIHTNFPFWNIVGIDKGGIFLKDGGGLMRTIWRRSSPTIRCNLEV